MRFRKLALPLAFLLSLLAIALVMTNCGGGSSSGTDSTGATGVTTSVIIHVTDGGSVKATSDNENDFPQTCPSMPGMHDCTFSGFAGKVTLNAQPAGGETFKGWTDKNGMDLGKMLSLPVPQGTTFEVTATFISVTTTTTSTGSCMTGSSSSTGGCPCPGGNCPITVADKLQSVGALRDLDQDLYFLDAQGIAKLPKAGGSPMDVIQSSVAAYAVDANGFYWIDGSGTKVLSTDLKGQNQKQLGLADATPHPQGIVVDQANVYYLSVIQKMGGKCTGIQRMPKTGGASVEVAEACDFQNVVQPYAIAMDNNYVYWGTIITGGGGAVWYADKNANAATATQIAASKNFSASHLVPDGMFLYWLQQGIERAPVPNPGNPVTLPTDMEIIESFTVDATDIYVAADQGLYKLAKMNPMPKLLANEPGVEILNDSTDVYWSSGPNGDVKILKLAK